MNQQSTSQKFIPGKSGARKPQFAYVGCYTSRERGGHGAGITVFETEADLGEWKEVQRFEIFNPSFLAFDRKQRYLYSAHGDECFLTAFSIDHATGRLPC